ncbi:MAG: hypothetical protein HYV28_08310 [Ignavibacteriales bacterium]|nr:hypothetical protein [Ignavibacteriales bacterium]
MTNRQGYKTSSKGMALPRARMYDADLGIFYGADPAGQGFAAYAYCGNNPVMRVDKDGKFFWMPIIIGAAIGGTLGGSLYSMEAANAWTWSGFGKAVGLGCLEEQFQPEWVR